MDHFVEKRKSHINLKCMVIYERIQNNPYNFLTPKISKLIAYLSIGFQTVNGHLQEKQPFPC